MAETVDWSEQEMIKFIDNGIDEKWLSEVRVYALDSNNQCVGQLTLKIDWDIHKQKMIMQEKVHLNNNKPWRGENKDISPGVSVVVSEFNKTVENEGLKTIWHLFYAPGVDGEAMNRQLGLHWAKTPQWKTSPQGEKHALTKLPELTIGYYYAD